MTRCTYSISLLTADKTLLDNLLISSKQPIAPLNIIPNIILAKSSRSIALSQLKTMHARANLDE